MDNELTNTPYNNAFNTANNDSIFGAINILDMHKIDPIDVVIINIISSIWSLSKTYLLSSFEQEIFVGNLIYNSHKLKVNDDRFIFIL